VKIIFFLTFLISNQVVDMNFSHPGHVAVANEEPNNSTGQKYSFLDGNLQTHQLYDNLLKAYSNKDSLSIAELLHRISTDYSSKGRWDRGESLALDALQISKAIEVDSTLASSYNALAISLRSKARDLHESGEIDENQFLQLADSVIYLYEKKLDALKNENLPLYEAYTYQGMGQMYLQTKEIRPEDIFKATNYFDQAMLLALSTNDLRLQFITQLWYGISLLHQEKFDEIFTLLDRLSPMLNHESLNSLSKYIYHNLKLSTFLRSADEEELLEILIERDKFLREVWLVDHQTEIAAMDRRYETSKTKVELEQQAKINELQQAQIARRNFFIVTMVILFIAIAVGTFYLYRLNLRNKELAENNEMLVREQNHRVKNNLQMISSLLHLQAKNSNGSSKSTILDSSRRVQSIALLHRRLYDDFEGKKEVDIKTYIEELLEEILFASSNQDIPVRLNLEEFKMPIGRAVHLALILNELVTNSLKHVFSRERLNGECIELLLKTTGDKAVLTYRDHGGVFDVDAFKKSESLGNQIIRSQAQYLSKEFKIENEDGFKFEIRFK
jgi:two-component sensor histidine kinase